MAAAAREKGSKPSPFARLSLWPVLAEPGQKRAMGNLAHTSISKPPAFILEQSCPAFGIGPKACYHSDLVAAAEGLGILY